MRSSQPTAPGRGGGRNRSDRVSYALSVAHVSNLVAATAQATTIDLPFTRMITIHWEAAGVPVSGMAKATGHFTDLMSKALARCGSKTAWLWVHEGGGKGGHCHLLVHLPAGLVKRVVPRQRGWLRCITGKTYRKRVIFSRPIGGRLGIENSNPNLHAVNLNVALAYLLKGASRDAALRFRLGKFELGGCVIGKRCGTSQNIGAAAREKRKEHGQEIQAIRSTET